MPLNRSGHAVLEGARSAALTYQEVGATAGGERPGGYRHMECRWTIGEGDDVFRGAARALMSWQMHRDAGLRVWASAPVAEEGSIVVLGLGVAALRLLAPCRVVYRLSEEHRKGFAYGTLPGHPESGEEAFVVEHQPAGSVVLQISAFSRPATRYARLAGRLNSVLQDAVTRRYASALRAVG